MDTIKPDALEVLKSEKEWLESRLSRVNLAIDALSGRSDSVSCTTTAKTTPGLIRRTKPPKMKRGKVQWAYEVRRVFKEPITLSPADIIVKLKMNGVKNLDNTAAKSVYATLNRMVEKGELFKPEMGKYSSEFGD